MLENIASNVSGYFLECVRTFSKLFDNIPQNVYERLPDPPRKFIGPCQISSMMEELRGNSSLLKAANYFR